MALLPPLSLTQAGRQNTRLRRQSAAELPGQEGRATCTTGCCEDNLGPENEFETNAMISIMPGLGGHTSSQFRALLLTFVLCAVNTMMVGFIAAPQGSLSKTCLTTLREEGMKKQMATCIATCHASTAASLVIQASQQSLNKSGRGRGKKARGDYDKEEYEDDEGMDQAPALATTSTIAGLRRTQPSKLTFTLPRDSPILTAAKAGHSGYFEKGSTTMVHHTARAMAILQYLCATPPPATIQHEEHLKLIEWTNALAERNITEACTMVRQCYTADCYDVAGHPRLNRLHIHLDSVVMIEHKLMSMNQLLIRNLTGLSEQKEAKACGPLAPHLRHERQVRQVLRNLIGGGR
mmetsp:Transcript_60596/g.171584  ORF Transcript_60596/g.171584 Transcript_60596/m.171584 type:complete len:350 (-) Transcript_60596:288-1337(-)